VSIDPIYQFSAEQIKQRVQETYEPLISQVKQNANRFTFGGTSGMLRNGRAVLPPWELLYWTMKLVKQQDATSKYYRV